MNHTTKPMETSREGGNASFPIAKKEKFLCRILGVKL